MISNSYYKFDHLNTFGVFSTSHNLEYLAIDAIHESQDSQESLAASRDSKKMKIVPHLVMPCVSSLNFFNTRTHETYSIPTNHSLITAFLILKKSVVRDAESYYEHISVMGFKDGSLRIYNMKGECLLSTKAHKSEITVITSDRLIDAQYLFVGSADTDISVFNLISMEPAFSLHGHKNSVTGLVYIPTGNALISSSKDMLLKVWELDTQHCVQTLVDTQNEIWALKANPSLSRLLVGCTDTEIRMLNLDPLVRPQEKSHVFERQIEFMGSLYRKSKERVLGVEWDSYGETIAVFGSSDSVIEFYVLRTEEEKEAYKNSKLRQLEAEFERRQQKTSRSVKFNEEEEEGEEKELSPQEWYMEQKDLITKEAEYEFRKISSLNLPHPVRSMKFAPFDRIQRDPKSSEQFRLAVVTTANTLAEYDIKIDGSHKLVLDLKDEGHTSSILNVMVSANNSFVASTSKSELKLWNYQTGKSFRNVKAPKIQCACLLPGEQYAVAGSQDGSLYVLDLNTSLIVEHTAKAHLREIWSVSLTPDGRGIVTGSADKSVKIWGLVVKEDEESGASFVGIEHEHTLQMNDDVQTTVTSENGKFLAIALLDSTVKIFYLDSLKFFLVLYGHSLPVNAIDISSDENLIVTGSSDKTIKIWGLDFGDCHKSIIAHGGPITSVKFVKDTHYFVTCSKDGSIKRWDADNYELIQVLREPFPSSSLISLALSDDGSLVVAGGHERALYVYQETDELLYLEEEKEKRMEEEFEKDLPKSQQFHDINLQRAESTTATQKTIESIRDGERLIDAIEVVIEEERRWEEYLEGKKQGMVVKAPDENPLLMKMTVDDYIWFFLKKIRRSEIVNVLSVLSYSHACFILAKLETMLFKQKLDIELTTKIVLTIARIHQNTLFKDSGFFKTLYRLNRAIKHDLNMEREVIGFNTAAVGLVKRRLQNEKEVLSMGELAQRAKLQYSTTLRRSKKQQEKMRKEQEKYDEMQADEDNVLPDDESYGRKAKRPRLDDSRPAAVEKKKKSLVEEFEDELKRDDMEDDSSESSSSNDSRSSSDSDSDSSSGSDSDSPRVKRKKTSNGESIPGFYSVGGDEKSIQDLIARLSRDD